MQNTTRNLTRTLALACGLALPMLPTTAGAAGPQPDTEAASFHTRLMQQLREMQHQARQPEWVNPWAPGVRVTAPVAAAQSADQRLQTIVGSYTRAQLDRGGWVNPWMAGDAYAAGTPLLAVAVGSGATSRGEPQRVPAALLAAR